MDFELAHVQRIVSLYLDNAQLQAMRNISMTMQDRKVRLSGFLNLCDRKILQDASADDVATSLCCNVHKLSLNLMLALSSGVVARLE